MTGQHRPCSASGWPARWAVSILDYAAHLLLAVGDHPNGALKARCGHLLLTNAHQYDHPPAGSACEDCTRILVTDAAVGGAACD